MPVRTTMVNIGIWEMPEISKKYKYRVAGITGEGRDWTIYRLAKERPLTNPVLSGKDAPRWEFIQTGFRSKELAIVYVEELAVKENFNPVADHLNNIDDGVDLDKEGY